MGPVTLLMTRRIRSGGVVRCLGSGGTARLVPVLKTDRAECRLSGARGGGLVPAAGSGYDASTDVGMAPSIAPSGGNQPHENLAPYLAMRYCIAVEGVYPPQS